MSLQDSPAVAKRRVRERGHGPKFQALMDLFLPNWRETRAKLRG